MTLSSSLCNESMIQLEHLVFYLHLMTGIEETLSLRVRIANFHNEIQFRIKLKVSEWKKSRPEVPISSQTLLNEIRFRIKLKHSE